MHSEPIATRKACPLVRSETSDEDEAMERAGTTPLAGT